MFFLSVSAGVSHSSFGRIRWKIDRLLSREYLINLLVVNCLRSCEYVDTFSKEVSFSMSRIVCVESCELFSEIRVFTVRHTSGFLVLKSRSDPSIEILLVKGRKLV
jgi:hypothetical protein